MRRRLRVVLEAAGAVRWWHRRVLGHVVDGEELRHSHSCPLRAEWCYGRRGTSGCSAQWHAPWERVG